MIVAEDGQNHPKSNTFNSHKQPNACSSTFAKDDVCHLKYLDYVAPNFYIFTPLYH